MEAWEVSTTGGPEISIGEAAQMLGMTQTNLKRVMSELDLKPSTPYNPTRRYQSIKFYLADVEAAKRRGRNPKTAAAVVAA